MEKDNSGSSQNLIFEQLNLLKEKTNLMIDRQMQDFYQNQYNASSFIGIISIYIHYYLECLKIKIIYLFY